MINVNDLIGIKFKNCGRSKDGYDCYGLAIEVSKRFGHELTDVFYEKSCGETFYQNAESVIKKMSSSLIESEERDAGNIVVFFDRKNRMTHIGVMLEDDRFIHCSEIYGVTVCKLDEYPKKWRIYKWQ